MTDEGHLDIYDSDNYELMLKQLGWPKLEVGMETPPLYEWYESDIEVDPDLDSGKRHPFLSNQNTLFEFGGTFQSGKSLLIHSLQEHQEIVAVDEPIVKVPGGLFMMEGLEFSDEGGVYIDRIETDWVEALAAHRFKDRQWVDRLMRLKEWNGYRFYDAMRTHLACSGPISNICWYYLHACHKKEYYEDEIGVPEEFIEIYQSAVQKLLIDSISFARNSSAVVLIGINQSEAQARRKGKSLSPYSDTNVFNELSSWYGYFIQHVWPEMYRIYGTGLLVLSGNNKPDDNIEKLVEFAKRHRQRLNLYKRF